MEHHGKLGAGNLFFILVFSVFRPFCFAQLQQGEYGETWDSSSFSFLFAVRHFPGGGGRVLS